MATMDLYDKTTKGLSRCIKLISDNNQWDECGDCPYVTARECSRAGFSLPMLRDALYMLEAQNTTIARLQSADDQGELVRCVKAKWVVKRNSPWASCSNCGHSFRDVYDIENYDLFCRHCGAIMEDIVSE